MQYAEGYYKYGSQLFPSCVHHGKERTAGKFSWPVIPNPGVKDLQRLTFECMELLLNQIARCTSLRRVGDYGISLNTEKVSTLRRWRGWMTSFTTWALPGMWEAQV